MIQRGLPGTVFGILPGENSINFPGGNPLDLLPLPLGCAAGAALGGIAGGMSSCMPGQPGCEFGSCGAPMGQSFQEPSRDSIDPTRLPKCSSIAFDSARAPINFIQTHVKRAATYVASTKAASYLLRVMSNEASNMAAAGAAEDGAADAALMAATADWIDVGAAAMTRATPYVAFAATDAALFFGVVKEVNAARQGLCTAY